MTDQAVEVREDEDGASPVALPPHSEVLVTSGPLDAEGALPPNTAAWLAGLQLASRYNR